MAVRNAFQPISIRPLSEHQFPAPSGHDDFCQLAGSLRNEDQVTLAEPSARVPVIDSENIRLVCRLSSRRRRACHGNGRSIPPRALAWITIDEVRAH